MSCDYLLYYIILWEPCYYVCKLLIRCLVIYGNPLAKLISKHAYLYIRDKACTPPRDGYHGGRSDRVLFAYAGTSKKTQQKNKNRGRHKKKGERILTEAGSQERTLVSSRVVKNT